MRRLLPLLLLIAAAHAHAQTVPNCGPNITGAVPYDSVLFTWTNPDKNTDGSPVKWPMTVTFYEGSGSTCQLVYATATLMGSASWSKLSLGQHAWYATAKTSDGESAPSNMVMKYVVPAGYHVDPTDTHIYTINTTDGAVTAIEVGANLPAGTMCDTSSIARPYGFAQTLYHVSETVAKPLLYSGQEILVAMAKCVPN